MSVVLGIDFGTTSVKVVLVGTSNGALLSSESEETNAYTGADVSQAAEQHVAHIMRALNRAMMRLPLDVMHRVVAIGVCGQMHGCMLWKRDCVDSQLDSVGDSSWVDENMSHLITWEDGRCNKEFLTSLPVTRSNARLATGYGCATLFWMQKHQTCSLKQFECSATVQDFFVACLCKLTVPTMSYHNADSWGYFNPTDCAWETDILLESGFPVHLLPVVASPGSVAGMTVKQLYGIPSGVPVLAALGDMQCSVKAAMETAKDAVLNVSTSAQLSYPCSLSESVDRSNVTVEYRPFTMKERLAVAASLNGGNVLAKFVSLLQGWVSELGLDTPSTETILSRLLECGEMSSELQISPQLYGERHCPDMLASVGNISLSLPSLGETFTALCDGLIANIASMLSDERLRNAGIERLVGTGNALVKNPVLQAAVKKHFSLPFVLKTGSDAAIGAAQFATEMLTSSSRKT